MLNIKTFNEEVPLTTELVTAVTEYDSNGLLIRDYVNGEPVNDGIYVSCVDFDDAILKYEYQNDTAYVDWTVEGKFQLLRENAELFIKCNGNIDEYATALEERMMSEAVEFGDEDE